MIAPARTPADKQRISDAILSHSRVNRPHKKLFCLGPNVGRVSFASQQIRALNLVWALREQKVIEPNSLVAVVGAGIAGITAAVALRAYRCTVKVFDRSEWPLFRQRSAIHRHVHPSLNWWPAEETLRPTTALPFLDWPLGQCDEIIRILAEQWNKLKEESGNELEFLKEHDVFEASPVAARGGRLTLRSTDKEQKDGFDVAIVASGFGDEKPCLNLETPSYWTPDNLEDYRDHPDKKVKRFVVSGFGDGGLIDALRIAYDFEYGKLSFRFSEALAVEEPHMQRIVQQIAAIENQRDSPQWLPASQGYETVALEIIQKKELAGLSSILEKKAQPKAGLVLLIDENYENPYMSGAAPAHKLMIAYAKLYDTLRYMRATLEKTDDPNTYTIKNETYTRNGRETYFVARHGAKHFPGKLLTDEEWDYLKAAQQNSIAYNFKPAWSGEPFAVPENWPCRDRHPERFIGSLLDRAKRAVANMGSTGWVVSARDCFTIVDHNLLYRPSELFGIPIKYKSLDEVRLDNSL